MNIPYEKMPTDEFPSSSDILIDGPIRAQPAPKRVRHYFIFSLFSALCLCPATGLIALAYSLKSSAKADVNFEDKARLYSRRALFWNLLSVIFAVVTLLVALAFFYYLFDAMSAYGRPMGYMYERQRSNEISNEVNRMIQSLSNDN